MVTAEEFLYENGFDGYHDNALVYITKENGEREHVSKIMIEFVKLHCEAQAKSIYEKSKQWKDASNGYSYQPIDKESILTAYPIENVK